MRNPMFNRPAWMKALALATAVAAQLMVPASARPGNDPRAPELDDCPALKVPAGNKVAFHTYAEGVQIYQWNGSAWQFIRPEAWLYADDRGNGVVGIHYAGPTWESRSGSLVRGEVLERCPMPGTIPWLLLRATYSEGPGVFNGVTYIQRVNTLGGAAPAGPGSFAGEEARVPYTAEYYFFRAHGK